MNKKQCRNLAKKKVRKISKSRQKIAALKVLNKFKNLTNKNILSFASTPLEINMWLLNEHLLQRNNLFFPKVVGDKLKIFHIKKINDLIHGSFNILEPDNTTCKEANIKEIDLIFTPGLAFDKYNNRLGHGRGFYDKLFSKFNNNKIGICFNEQVIDQVPIDLHDQKIDQLFYF